ncbi:MAG: 3 beta-hydroxysteroid dehydrogenase/Delta 5--_4-isomerase [Chloroflexi bacterium ADurb.Bin325]|nr:MAG: 3 beta-hydroxysteroid dehydrogenase/Delta 5-->4-isomerase [Chloroflexi bacterium ADurb.Bin325]
MRVLITGACGFLGRRLIRELEERGHELRLLDRVRPEDATVYVPSSGARAAEPLVTDWPFVVAEILDAPALRAAAEGMDAVVHLAAAVTGLPQYGVETFRDNALGTFIVLDAARLAGARRFLCASSINAYGTIFWRISGQPSPYVTMPLDESFEPVPEDPYSLSKYVNEITAAAFHRAYGITTAAFRFAGVWTEAMYEQRLAEGLPPTTAWSDTLYQWVHVLDIATGLRQALEAPDLPGHGVYTLGAADTRCPEPTLELLRRFRPDLAANVTAPLEGRAPLIAIDRARQTFGYNPRYRLGP